MNSSTTFADPKPRSTACSRATSETTSARRRSQAPSLSITADIAASVTSMSEIGAARAASKTSSALRGVSPSSRQTASTDSAIDFMVLRRSCTSAFKCSTSECREAMSFAEAAADRPSVDSNFALVVCKPLKSASCCKAASRLRSGKRFASTGLNDGSICGSLATGPSLHCISEHCRSRSACRCRQTSNKASTAATAGITTASVSLQHSSSSASMARHNDSSSRVSAYNRWSEAHGCHNGKCASQGTCPAAAASSSRFLGGGKKDISAASEDFRYKNA
mmetsp:Transcript_2042/g.4923  ORF Transcript_2042/g.4923 Transcript_2042/m.4923 type:complete len:278 (+) Transcript_2042:840-1673(+)